MDSDKVEQLPIPADYLRSTVGHVPCEAEWRQNVGDSNDPHLRDGVMMLVERVKGYVGPGRYLVRLDGQEEVVKRMERLGGRVFRLSSDNRSYAAFEVEHVSDDTFRPVGGGPAARIEVLGVVVLPPDTRAAVLDALDAHSRALGIAMGEALRACGAVAHNPA